MSTASNCAVQSGWKEIGGHLGWGIMRSEHVVTTLVAVGLAIITAVIVARMLSGLITGMGILGQ